MFPKMSAVVIKLVDRVAYHPALHCTVCTFACHWLSFCKNNFRSYNDKDAIINNNKIIQDNGCFSLMSVSINVD